MTTLFTYARDASSDTPLFAVVADDSGAQYVFPPDVEPWLDFEQRKEFLLGDAEPPTDAEGWFNVATANLGQETQLDPPFDDVDSAKEAVKVATKYLGETATEPRVPQRQSLTDARDAYDQASADYPELGDDDNESLLSNPEALDNMVLMALGPIDPEGPNGWILRAMDGNPQPGDENEYVHFPGTMASGPDPDSATETSEVDNSAEEEASE